MGFVTAICPVPGVTAGATTVSVLMSLNATDASFPPMVTEAPDWKPLPRMVRMVPPEAGPEVGEIVPMESGTVASWITVRPELVRAKILWPFSSMARSAERPGWSRPARG